jgi:hypothetical protein
MELTCVRCGGVFVCAGRKDENKQSADHSHTVVDNLRSRLKDATLQFKDVLTLRTENLKVCWVFTSVCIECGGRGGGTAGTGGSHSMC